MPTDYQQYGPWPSCGEIDLAEVIGSQPGTLYGTLHYGHPWKNSGVHYVLPDGKRFADDFHRFALEWAPGRIKWFVDDIYFGDQTNWYTSAPGAMWPAPFDRAFYIQFNLAVGGNWPGRPDDTTPFPARMRIDYVRVYKFNGEYPPVEKRSAAPLELRPRDPLPDGNLVYNGDFAEGRKCWEFETFEGAQAAMEAASSIAAIVSAIPLSNPFLIFVHAPLHIIC
jgi:beta-glucanase (GH16 family)